MSCKTSRKTKSRLRGVKKLRKQSQSLARYFKPFRFLDLPPELRTKIYEFALVCCDVISITRISHKEGCTNRRKLATLHHQNCKLANRDTHPVTELLQTCKKIRHETSFMFYNNNAFGLEDDPTLILWLEMIGPANRTALRSLMIEGDCCYEQASIGPWLDPLHIDPWHIYDPDHSFLMAPSRDPYRKLTVRIGDLLSESMLLEALYLPCGYSFWRLPVLTVGRRDAYPVPWQTQIARRIAETLFKDFQAFFEKRLLLEKDTEKLSKVIMVNVISRKDRSKTWSPAVNGVLTKIEEGAGHLNLLLKHLQHIQVGGKLSQFCLPEIMWQDRVHT
ncbi:uncharacterized protein BDZ83DRAFT_418717 [Colletotrichum acutatum]|uniref:DUF7730 domain-containing protein n=1 Tax=Glomerella acutata TaxID=27357 RepID=A0AAD8UEG7_GLOAC|nr:uncharacterized protein BDZ83DRAFT_418717 [Colletotrichum acutatum]KAK1722421.1 hypothetical protein BDZ83DRAFT_418717 [Colletotrichum acutatum]